MDVHVRELRSFLAVAEHLSFTRAAEVLFLTQPALSKQIRALEGQLGARLFDRDRRTVALTSVGARLLPAAGAVVAAWDAARLELARAASGSLTVGLQTSPGRGVLPAVRARLAIECPEVELVVRQVGWVDATAGLADGSCDAAFLWLPLPDVHGLSTITIAVEPRCVLLAADHRLAARRSVAMHELVDEPFLALPRASARARDFWLAADQRGGRDPVVVAEIRSTEETYETVAAGIGVCLLASGNAPIFDRDGVVMVPVIDIPPAELVLAWRRGERSGLLGHFVCASEAIVDGERAAASAT